MGLSCSRCCRDDNTSDAGGTPDVSTYPQPEGVNVLLNNDGDVVVPVEDNDVEPDLDDNGGLVFGKRFSYRSFR
jgi:hypothetical protein